MAYSGRTATNATAAVAMPCGRSTSAVSAAAAGMKPAAITAPPNPTQPSAGRGAAAGISPPPTPPPQSATQPSAGGAWAAPIRRRMPGSVQAASAASLTCQPGIAMVRVAGLRRHQERLGQRDQGDDDERRHDRPDGEREHDLGEDALRP